MKTINYEFRIILCYSSANNTRGTQYFNRYFLILETTTTQYIPQDIDDRVCDRLCTVCAVDDDDDDDNKSSKYGGIQLGKFLPETILPIFSNVVITIDVLWFHKIQSFQSLRNVMLPATIIRTVNLLHTKNFQRTRKDPNELILFDRIGFCDT